MKQEHEFWDSISKTYDKQVQTRFAKAYEDTIKKVNIYLNSSDTILDFGCGTGIVTTEISKNAKEILALDYSENMISIAKNKAIQRGIKNIKFSVSSIVDSNLLVGTYNVILAINVLCYIKDDEKALNRIYELLAPEGVFISVTDCLGEKFSLLTQIEKFLSNLGVLPFINFYKTYELVNKINQNGFHILESENIYDMPPNYFIAAKKV